jgi:hypothetical protein
VNDRASLKIFVHLITLAADVHLGIASKAASDGKTRRLIHIQLASYLKWSAPSVLH